METQPDQTLTSETVINETLTNETLTNETLTNETVAGQRSQDAARHDETGQAETPESDEQEDMPTSEERLFILRMLEQGKIKAEEAARLLSALDAGQSTPPPPENRDPFDPAHGVRIRVQDLRSGKEQVNINIPAGLVRFGLRFVPSTADVDIEAIQNAIDRGSIGKILEVVDQDSGKRVQIFVE